MAKRATERLSALDVTRLTAVGRHADGNNLYLSISKNGGRRWTFFYRCRATGRLKEMGLGSVKRPMLAGGVSLKDAREAAEIAQKLLRDGKDPIEQKRAQLATRRSEHARARYFGEYFERWLELNGSQFKNAKHLAQWQMTLRVYAAPLHKLRIDEIETQHIRDVVEPLWLDKHETANRLRGRIERILDAATSDGLRSGDNPARWKGHLANILPKRQKLARGHHSALPYPSAPTFYATLRNRNSISARALEFTVLTAARTNETIGAQWFEVDFESAIWTVPAARMKAQVDHNVPLSERALQLLKQLKTDGTPEDGFIFTRPDEDKPLSNMAMLELLRGMHDDVTVHGFRSTFRDWAGEETSYPRDLIETALAHTIENKSEAAYRRMRAVNKRRKLMEDWAYFLGGTL